MKTTILVLAVILGIGGCATSTMVRSVDDSALLVVEGAPSEASLYVDGLSMGNASQYTMKKGALALESGTHLIEVKSETQSFFYGKKFLGPGQIETVRANGGGAS